MPGDCRDWCATVNGPEDKLVAWHEAMVSEPVGPPPAKFGYFVMQPERGAGGTLHIQAFGQFNKKCVLSTAKRQFHAEIVCPHLEPRKGTPLEAAEYCRKPDSYVYDHPILGRYEQGDLSGAGRRNDLEELARGIADRTTTLSDVAQTAPAQFVRFHRGLQALADSVRLPYAGGPKTVLVYYGPTGTGKTRSAFEENPGAYFWGPEQGKWFQMYSGEETTILDEYRGQLPFGFLLRLTDRYPMKIELKGSSTEFVSSRIIICSPVHPLLWYPSLSGSEGKMDQLMRRISSVKWFGEGPEPPTPDPVTTPTFGQFA